jgi:ADP-ribosyl-[dinitrogen reductase] hydrolase
LKTFHTGAVIKLLAHLSKALHAAHSGVHQERIAASDPRTTHGTKAAIDACRYFAGLIIGGLQGRPKEELLSPYFNPTDESSFWNENDLDPKIAAIAAGSFKTKEPPEIKGTGYVVESLEAALWAFDRSNSFREGELLAVNLGGDADTTRLSVDRLRNSPEPKRAGPASTPGIARRSSILGQPMAVLILS